MLLRSVSRTFAKIGCNGRLDDLILYNQRHIFAKLSTVKRPEAPKPKVTRELGGSDDGDLFNEKEDEEQFALRVQPKPKPWKISTPNNHKRHGANNNTSNNGSDNKDVVIKNERIRHPKLRVVFDKVENEGDPKWQIMSKVDALALAKKKKLDLILVTDTTDPPVCKLASAFNVEVEKKRTESETKAKLRARSTKEIVIGALIDPHDLEIKSSKINSFLEDGHSVKVSFTIKFKEYKVKPKALDEIVLKFVKTLDQQATSVTSSRFGDLKHEFLLHPKSSK